MLARQAVAVVVVMVAWFAVNVGRADVVVYVATSGDDGNAGTNESPLATLAAAMARIDSRAGGEVRLLDGTWDDRSRVTGAFAKPVVIRAVHAGRAVLRDCLIHAAENVVLDGIVFDGRDNPAITNVCQVSQSRYVTLRNSEFTHGVDGHQNADALKVNDGSHHVLVERCRLHDGTDEELDILQADVHDLVFRDNVFHQVRIRKPEAGASVKKNAHRVAFIGNLFANMNAEASNGGLRFGGSERTDERPHDLLAVGNAFINNDGRCDLNLGGATRVVIAENVFFGQRGCGVIEASTNYPAGGNPNDDIFIVNNIVADPTGRLPTIYAWRNGTVERLTIRNNLYFNGGVRIPSKGQGRAFFNPLEEEESQVADPLFVGSLEFTGIPSLRWRDAVAVRGDSPFRRGRVHVEQLNLPSSLREFYAACTSGQGGDVWYGALSRSGEPPRRDAE